MRRSEAPGGGVSLAERTDILLISERSELEGFGGRLLLNGFRGRPVPTWDEVEDIVSTQEPPIHAAILPTTFDFASRAEPLERIRKAALSPRLRWIAAGDPPSDAVREAMRRAAVDFLLCEPITDAEIRFILNAAVWHAGRGDSRRATRVPTDLVARVHAGTGMKVASIYNLSVGGAFLETPRPSQEHARVEVEIPLPSGALRMKAQVMLTNVAGNLKRDNLPRGMGVQFLDPTMEDRAALERYIEEQSARYRP